MRFVFVSLFPEFFESPLGCGLMQKARDAGIVDFDFINPRDFTEDRHRTVDDRPYGGGPGMVMMADPLARALRHAQGLMPGRGRLLLMSPRGRPLDQSLARELSGCDSLAFVCGRYEGVDARLLSLFPLEEVSVGDFVLGGGEAAALCLSEAVGRLLPGFMGHEGSAEEESFSAGLLEYPHYTRPDVYEGLSAPEVLTSGDHGRIAAWRREAAVCGTWARRPELLARTPLTRDELRLVRELKQRGGAGGNDPAAESSTARALGKNLYVALLHYPVRNKFGETLTVSLTNLDIHDIGRSSRCYALGGYYLATPLEDQQRLARELIDHWVRGPGRNAIPDRALALERVKVAGTLDDVVADIAGRTGRTPRLIATSARPAGKKNATDVTVDMIRQMLHEEPVLILLGAGGSGLAPQILERARGTLRPLRPYDAYNHFSVRSAAAIIMDRILGDEY